MADVAQSKIYPITSLPGIKRDGTRFLGRYYADGQWVRFYRGLPRKMGGYNRIVGTASTGIPTGLFVVPDGQNFDVYIGNFNTLNYITIDLSGNPIGGFSDITPFGLINNFNNIWQFGIMFSTVSNGSILIAHAAPSLASINSQAETPVFYWDIHGADPRMQSTGFTVSGGVMVLHPFLFMFGNNGQVTWTEANNPTVSLGSARICALKIVCGLSTRGGNSSPAGLLWSLDSVIRVTFVPDPSGPNFRFDTISNQSSILSSRSVIEYDSLYFWAANDRFLVYNGTVQELQNDMNQNYFFDNLNFSARQAVWVTKVPRWGEIIWFYPSGNSLVCDRALIYNKRENTWYDTALARSCGYFEQTFGSPIWADSLLGDDGFDIWQHEYNINGTPIYNKVVDGVSTAIDSYFQTGDIAYAALGPDGNWNGFERNVDLYRIEPDFVQVGNLTVTPSGRPYANSAPVTGDIVTFDNTVEKIDIHFQERELTLKFESNEIDGFYELGQTLITMRTGDTRP